jgi:hypothetical protein
MSRFSYLPLLVVALATAVILPAGESGAEQGPATVLMNVPASSVCVGETFTVGVWYQQYSGGSRAYRIAVYGPGATQIFYRLGMAPSSNSAMWNIRTTRIGTYRTVYYVLGRSRFVWRAFDFATRSHRC